MIKKMLSGMLTQREEKRRSELYRNLIRHEAKIGGQLFGPVPKGHRREFFCLDRSTWVWHEEWLDSSNQRQSRTTRYDIRPTGILKAQGGTNYQQVSPQEARHLYEAVKLYQQLIRNELYNFV